jgi:hypothetical protein
MTPQQTSTSPNEEKQETYETISKADKISMTHLKVDKLFLPFQDFQESSKKSLSYQQLTPPSTLWIQDCRQIQRKTNDTSLYVKAEPNDYPIFNSILAAPNIGTTQCVGFPHDPYLDQLPRTHSEQDLFDSLVSVAPMEVDRQDTPVPNQLQILTSSEANSCFASLPPTHHNDRIVPTMSNPLVGPGSPTAPGPALRNQSSSSNYPLISSPLFTFQPFSKELLGQYDEEIQRKIIIQYEQISKHQGNHQSSIPTRIVEDFAVRTVPEPDKSLEKIYNDLSTQIHLVHNSVHGSEKEIRENLQYLFSGMSTFRTDMGKVVYTLASQISTGKEDTQSLYQELHTYLAQFESNVLQLFHQQDTTTSARIMAQIIFLFEKFQTELSSKPCTSCNALTDQLASQQRQIDQVQSQFLTNNQEIELFKKEITQKNVDLTENFLNLQKQFQEFCDSTQKQFRDDTSRSKLIWEEQNQQNKHFDMQIVCSN